MLLRLTEPRSGQLGNTPVNRRHFYARYIGWCSDLRDAKRLFSIRNCFWQSLYIRADSSAAIVIWTERAALRRRIQLNLARLQPIARRRQLDLSRFLFRLNNHFRKPVENAPLPIHWRGLFSKLQQHTLIDAPRPFQFCTATATEFVPACKNRFTSTL